MLAIKEVFGPTLQGEGTLAGSPAIFIRFAGCNMWDGLPEHREASHCPFCDTEFRKGNPVTPIQLFEQVVKMCQHRKYLIVFTGGEPLLQKEDDLLHLINLFHDAEFKTQVETNGTVNSAIVHHFDHVCVSPKLPFNQCAINWDNVDSIKILFPHPNPDITPESFNHLSYREKYLQPIDAGNGTPGLTTKNVGLTIAKVLKLGAPWRLSMQMHKIVGLP